MNQLAGVSMITITESNQQLGEFFGDQLKSLLVMGGESGSGMIPGWVVGA